MPTVQFAGKIVPIRPPHEIGELPPFVWENVETGERESYEITFSSSDVSARVTIDHEIDEANVSRYRNTAMELARTALNIVCFVEGIGLLLYLDRYIPNEGKPELLVPGDPRLKSLVTLTSINVPVLSTILAGDSQLSRPLSDLINAITWPFAAPINCARAVEGIRKHNNPNEGDARGASWKMLQDALNISKEYLEFIGDMSVNPRHGSSAFIEPTEQEECIVRAWTIMDRYFRYLGGGRKPLTNLPLL